MKFRPFPPLTQQAFLLVAGAVLGSVGTLSVQFFVHKGDPVSGVTASAADPAKGPARTSALPLRTGDHPVKLNQILTADDPSHKPEDLRNLGQEAARASITDALALSARISGETDRLNFLQGVFDVWGDQAPADAADYARTTFKPGTIQSETISLAVADWAAKNPREAFVWVEKSLSGPIKEEATNSMVQSWAHRAPEAAAAWFLETGSTSQPLLTSLVSGWASRSPKQAAEWVNTLTDPGNKEVGRVAAAGEWARQDPAEAAKYFTPVISEPAPAGSNRAPGVNLADVLADIWGTSNPGAAAAWISELPAGPGREEAARTLATVWAASDINGAVAWSGALADTNLKQAVIANLGTTWGAIEPDKAIQWLQTLPPAQSQEGLIGAYNSWAGTDPNGLYEWIATEPPGPAMDQARQSLAEVWTDTDPAAAMDLAAGLSSPDRQADAMGRFYRKWRTSDAASANDWLQSQWSNLPAGAQKRLASEQARVTLQ